MPGNGYSTVNKLLADVLCLRFAKKDTVYSQAVPHCKPKHGKNWLGHWLWRCSLDPTKLLTYVKNPLKTRIRCLGTEDDRWIQLQSLSSCANILVIVFRHKKRYNNNNFFSSNPLPGHCRFGVIVPSMEIAVLRALVTTESWYLLAAVPSWIPEPGGLMYFL